MTPSDTDAALFAQLPKDWPQKGFTLCMIGGGQDGLAVTQAFAQADLSADEYRVIVTRPFLLPPQKQRLLDWPTHIEYVLQRAERFFRAYSRRTRVAIPMGAGGSFGA